MPRRYTPAKREVDPDPRYGSVRVAKLINRVMRDGKKSLARALVYEAFDLVEERMGRDALEAYEEALNNITPRIEVKARRVGGSTYQIPIEVDAFRANSLALRWMIAAARGRGGRGFANKLANEIMDAANGQGAAVRRKEETHRMAEANRTFAHYRF